MDEFSFRDAPASYISGLPVEDGDGGYHSVGDGDCSYHSDGDGDCSYHGDGDLKEPEKMLVDIWETCRPQLSPHL